MNKKELLELEWLRRTAAQWTEKWRAIGPFIHDADGLYIGQTVDERLSEFVVRLHNMFTVFANAILMQRKKLLDRGKARNR